MFNHKKDIMSVLSTFQSYSFQKNFNTRVKIIGSRESKVIKSRIQAGQSSPIENVTVAL